MMPTVLLALATAIAAPPVCPGNLYSVKIEGEQVYRVTKVLAVKPPLVFVRFYRNRFETRPAEVDAATLVVGKVSDPEGYGTSCLAIQEKTFLAESEPRFIRRTAVTEEELERAEEQLGVNGLRDARDAGARNEACRAPSN
jgi:hypothetical protein